MADKRLGKGVWLRAKGQKGVLLNITPKVFKAIEPQIKDIIALKYPELKTICKIIVRIDDIQKVVAAAENVSFGGGKKGVSIEEIDGAIKELKESNK